MKLENKLQCERNIQVPLIHNSQEMSAVEKKNREDSNKQNDTAWNAMKSNTFMIYLFIKLK